jgi:ferredoxin--NADP+ reductase
VPFDDERMRILNRDGRVLDPRSREPIPGVYTAGWVKRGPSGVIGTNKKCATETVELLLADFAAGRLPEPSETPERLIEQLRAGGHPVVEYDGWQAIDAHERSLGEPHGRPRVKLVSRVQQLAIAAGEPTRQPA